MNLEQLRSGEQALYSRFLDYQKSGLKLDLTRGKPGPDQLDLSEQMEGLLNENMQLEDGTDLRNYGGINGIPSARQLGAQLLGLRTEEVMAADHSSLTLMYLYMLHAFNHGPLGAGTAWKDEGEIKFLCLVPGYDRHFTICEELGIRMINVGWNQYGPDLDQIESLASKDPSVKGMWCVPKYSNPTGHVFSMETVDRIAALGKIAGKHFRVMWDNAYAVHDLDDQPPELDNVMDRARVHGTENSLVLTASTSKITFAGAGISFIGASPENLEHFRKRLGVMTIGPNKLNQQRHVSFLKDLAGVRAHMRKHSRLLAPKFKAVQHHLEQNLNGKGMGTWSNPKGGYFISFDALPGTAAQIVSLAAAAGVKLTPAGATFPYGLDPHDSNIRLAPTFPSLHEVEKAMGVFVLCVQLASVRKRIKELDG